MFNPFTCIASQSNHMLKLHSVWEQLQINAFKSYGVYTTGALRQYVGKRVKVCKLTILRLKLKI